MDRGSRRVIGSNLKMASDRDETMALLDAAVQLSAECERQFFFFPSMVFVAEAVQRVAGSDVIVGGQTCSRHVSGAYTGEVSARMLAQVGANAVMVGHYERTLAGESLQDFIDQAMRAQEADLRVLFCLGERDQTDDPHDASDLLTDVDAMRAAGLDAPWIVAYEPHWAIGETGRRPEPGYVSARLAALRFGLDERGWRESRLVYGGSVDRDNARDIDGLADGLFIGRAAWTPEGLRAVCEATK